jgi:phage regulator Rha-like protein
MQELSINQKGMMSSKRIAESTGKEHGHVIRDIKNMIIELEKDNPKMDSSDYQLVMNGKTGLTSEILLNERLSICLAGGYSVTLRMAIIDDWARMKANGNMPSNYLEALKLLVVKQEEKERLELKVDNLSTALDSLVEWVSIVKVSQFNKISEKNFNWRVLKSKSQEMGFIIKRGESSVYGYRNLYHVNCFKACYPQYNYKFLNNDSQLTVR